MSTRIRDFFGGVGVIVSLELRQRVRGNAWYILLGIFVGLIAIVTFLLTVALNGFGSSNSSGGIFSTVIYFVLLLGTLVTPALSGNAINGERDAGTLATTQVTLVTTWQIVVGKFLAAWITALAFLAAAVPFLVYASFVGELTAGTIIVSVLILALELGVVAAIGVGLSGLLTRPLFSIVVTYLVVAALSIGTLIAFTLGGLAVQMDVRTVSSSGTVYDANGSATECATQTYESKAPRFDLFWGVLVANPYVILADAVPTQYNEYDQPNDLFGMIKLGVRYAQITPPAEIGFDECEPESYDLDQPESREVIESTVPGWFVGAIIHILLAAGALAGAWARTRTPAARLARGSRIA